MIKRGPMSKNTDITTWNSTKDCVSCCFEMDLSYYLCLLDDRILLRTSSRSVLNTTVFFITINIDPTMQPLSSCPNIREEVNYNEYYRNKRNALGNERVELH